MSYSWGSNIQINIPPLPGMLIKLQVTNTGTYNAGYQTLRHQSPVVLGPFLVDHPATEGHEGQVTVHSGLWAVPPDWGQPVNWHKLVFVPTIGLGLHRPPSW